MKTWRKSPTSSPCSIGKKWLNRPAVYVTKGGREICNPATDGGILQYWFRRAALWLRQEGLCCICCRELKLSDATFEHENGRGGGKRDDRIEIDGQPINGASHLWCNSLRGSKRTPIYHYPQYELRDDMISEEQFENTAIYLIDKVCVCGRTKRSGQPLCEDCNGKLSPQQQFDIDTSRGDIAYLKGVLRAQKFVLGWSEEGVA